MDACKCICVNKNPNHALNTHVPIIYIKYVEICYAIFYPEYFFSVYTCLCEFVYNILKEHIVFL